MDLFPILGKGMPYMPGAANLAATHRSKIKNIRLTTLRDTCSNVDPRSAILDFEKDVLGYDKSMKDKVEGMHPDLKLVCAWVYQTTFYREAFRTLQ